MIAAASLPSSLLPGPPAGWSPWEGTLAQAFSVSGRGLHTGRKVHVRLLPASGKGDERGIQFQRIKNGALWGKVLARHQAWRKYPLCSTLESTEGILFRTVEHLLASLLLCEIDHARIELDAEELPIFDGGASEWVRIIAQCGRHALPRPKKFLKIIQACEHSFGGSSRYRIEPSDNYTIQASVRVHGFAPMHWEGAISPAAFAEQIAPSRSYGHFWLALPAMLGGLLSGIPVLRGARFSSVAAILGGRVLGGMTVPEEFARHKVLDMLGDFALAGSPFLGKLSACQPSHRRNHRFLKMVLKQKQLWEWRSFSG